MSEWQEPVVGRRLDIGDDMYPNLVVEKSAEKEDEVEIHVEYDVVSA